MENQNNNPTNTADTNHPKPTDDVQKTIETVIPENEKEGLPNNQEHNHRSGETTEEAPQDVDSDKDQKDSGDIRDEVETTSV